ncbi:hypothetical protein ACHHYP_20664 [Achlya hypogyna]|uniref:Uncharacterized protein n=1 Tax=Achlya hypogyna TaxID=1202772 RepID=A0A1V9YFL5_ACHHY|nr:hypothetical protein ACHHYP_20664 [Achlya hypogyna]
MAAPKKVAGGIDDSEQDSAGAEDLTDDEVASLVLPQSWTRLDRFAVAVSRQALRGWVKQPSPSCAAASLAGVLNVLHNYPREDPRAYSCMGVLEVFRQLFRDKIHRQKTLMELRLGQPIAPLEAAVVQSLATDGLELGGVGNNKVAKNVLRRHVFASIERGYTTAASHELYGVLHDALSTSSADEEPPRDDMDDDLPGSDAAASSVWWRASLGAYFHRLDGLAKLERQHKPSTAICGNQTLIEGVNLIFSTASESPLSTLRARYFMGKRLRGVRIQHELEPSDTATGRDADVWRALWSAFTAHDTALLFHLTNHYALIFALREWVDADGAPVRQVLTSRKGQRPSAWLDWAEVYAVLLGWSGYRVLAFQKT